MKVKNTDIKAAINRAETYLAGNVSLSQAKAIIKILLLIVNLFVERLSTNSKNSSKPPSKDPNRSKESKPKSKNKQGGQKGHRGSCLKPVSNPDKIVELKLDKKSLEQRRYTKAGYESRQEINIKISREVTEYRAEVLQDSDGNKYVASFPPGVTQKVQYGSSVKAHAVYMSGFQLIPYNRIEGYFSDQMKIPLSAGSIFNFNEEAYDKLELFDEIAKAKLLSSNLIHADETGININGKLHWLHVAANKSWTYFYPHEKRGSVAINEIDILPNFTGVLCHDHLSSYYTYKDCTHSLCNAHHLRELQNVIDLHNHKWAKNMQEFLCEINDAVTKAGGKIDKEQADKYRQRYREILSAGDLESPAPPPDLKKDGSISKREPKKEKHRNLLERLRNFENDVLRFMEETHVPFTNNLAENDLRMTKVHQKISGCFRSLQGSKMFCRIRSYLLTCQKHDVKPTEALQILFKNELPDFCTDSEG